MKTVTIMQAQHNLSEVLRTIQRGGRVAITRHKKVVAELVPPSSTTKREFPDFEARAKKTWGADWTGSSSEELIDELRGER